MVEHQFLPFFCRMAFFALVTVAPGVNIIDAMAGDALPRDIFIVFVRVAAVARCFLMLAA